MKSTQARQTWLSHIKQCDESQLSMSGYAKTHNLNIRHFYQARSTFRKEGLLGGDINSSIPAKPTNPTGFTQVRLSHPRKPVPVSEAVLCEIHFKDGHVLRFDPALPSVQIKILVSTLMDIGL
jgi:hypothetical protein